MGVGVGVGVSDALRVVGQKCVCVCEIRNTWFEK